MRLDLPKKLRKHNVFNVSLLRPYIEGKSPRSPPIPKVLDGEHEFVVEKIVKHDLIKVSSTKTQLECLVKWTGYTDDAADTAIPASRLAPSSPRLAL